MLAAFPIRAPAAQGEIVNSGQRAHLKVADAVARGRIPPARDLKCIDCGKPAQGYDHRDYSQPLAIEPVCRSCNRRRGSASGYEGSLRRQVPLSDATWDAIRHAAIDERETVGELIEALLKQWLSARRKMKATR